MKKIKLFLLVFLVPFMGNAQNFEGGLFAGVTSYAGDLSARRADVKELKEAYGGFLRYNINDYITLRLNLAGGRMSGSDATSGEILDQQWRLERNLSFESNVYEASFIPEFNILGFNPYNLRRVLSPYVFGGVGVLRYNPKAEFNGDLVPLQPLGTEGQGMAGFEDPYKLTQVVIPMGAGIKFAINDMWNVGAEINVRKTFTDYLDDVSGSYVNRADLLEGNGQLSADLANRTGEFLGTDPVSLPTGTQRGNAAFDDWYGQFVLTLSYNFVDNGLVGWRRKNSRKSGCPTNF